MKLYDQPTSNDMSTSLITIESQALELPPEERVQLADHLLASLSSDPHIENAWFVEVERRLAEIEAGRSVLLPVELAIERARQSLA